MKTVLSFALALLCASTCAASADPGGKAAAEAGVRNADLVGSWTCAGKDALQKQVKVAMRFFHTPDAVLNFALDPGEVTFTDPSILERWTWVDDAATGYHGLTSTADKSTFDKAPFHSPGFADGAMVWVRQPAAIRVIRTIRKLGKDKLYFLQENGPNADHAYALTCVRTSKAEPSHGK